MWTYIVKMNNTYKIVYDEEQVKLFQEKYYSSDNTYLHPWKFKMGQNP